MFCYKCGAENQEEAEFCSKCGAGIGVPAASAEGEARTEAETTAGMAPNVAGLLCYVFGWITGIVFVILEKKSTFVKFHAWQSIMTFGVLTVAVLTLGWIPIVGPILYILVWALWVVLAIVLIIQAHQGKMWKVPGAGNWAEKQAGK